MLASRLVRACCGGIDLRRAEMSMNHGEPVGVSRRSMLKGGAAAFALGGVALAEPARAVAAAPRIAAGDKAVTKPIPTPEQYFGFRIGSEGKLATWDKMVPYFELISANSTRVLFERVGDTTNGNPYVLLTISAKKNLDRLDDLVAMNSKLADPRGLSPTQAQSLATEGLPFYFVQAGIHSTEVGNSQATIEWVHRL